MLLRKNNFSPAGTAAQCCGIFLRIRKQRLKKAVYFKIMMYIISMSLILKNIILNGKNVTFGLPVVAFRKLRPK